MPTYTWTFEIGLSTYKLTYSFDVQSYVCGVQALLRRMVSNELMCIRYSPLNFCTSVRALHDLYPIHSL